MNTSNETASIADQFCSAESAVVIQTIKVPLYVVVILVSLIGNALIFCVVYKSRRMRTPVNFFVVNMSAADLLITVFYMPRMISRAFLGMEWGMSGDFGHVLCKVLPFTQELSASVSVLTLILMAVDRFFAVLFPLQRLVTNRVAYASILLVWLIAVAIRSPMFYGIRFVLAEEGKTYCDLHFDSELASFLYVKFAFIMFYVVPLFVIVVLYSAVLMSLKNRKPIGVDLSKIQRRCKDRLKRTRKVMNMLFTIVSIFAVGWCLHFFLPVLYSRFRTKVCALVFPAFFLGHATSAINPCIYLIYIENYRRGFREILNPLCLRCFSSRSPSSRVVPVHGLAVEDGGDESNRANLTLNSLDCGGTAKTTTITVLPTTAAGSTSFC